MTELELAPSIERIEPAEIVFRPAYVTRVQRVIPGFVTVTLAGEALDGFESLAPDDDIRVVLPIDFRVEPLPPVIHRDPFRLVYPPGAPPVEIKAYTVRRHRPESGEIDLEIATHGPGVGARWAGQARPGLRVAITNVVRSRIVRGFPSTLMLADESGFPAVARMLEEAPPGHQVDALLLVEGPDDRRPFETDADLNLSWVYRDESPDPLLRVFEHLAASGLSRDGYLFAAGEAAETRALRRFAFNTLGWRRDWAYFRGYWLRDANFVDDDPEPAG